MALAPDLWSFAAAFIVVQMLGQLTEYDATFAVAVDLAQSDARKAMSQITLWGGLASTAFWPATAFLLQHMSWQHMLLVYAGLLAVVSVPIAAHAGHASVRHGERCKVASAEIADATLATPAPAPSPLVFSVLAAAFAFGGVAYTLPALMLPVLEGLGLGATAVVAGMLFGPAQTAGRFMDLLLGARVRALHVAILATAMLVFSLGVLWLGSSIAWMAMVFALLFGAGAGVSYVARGSVVLEIYGTQAYALWLGRLSSVRLVVSAASPFVLSLVLERLGAASVVAVCLGVALLSLGCFGWLAQRLR
jgi:MFS family permease